MEIFKAEWFAHGSLEPSNAKRKGRGGPLTIFSVHVDANGERLASGGLDGSIRIWSLKTLMSTDNCQNLASQSLLAAMTRHDGAVLCVRWSPNGELLASSADDCVILIWRRENLVGSDASALAINSTFQNAVSGIEGACLRESYRVIQRLTEHSSDVNGLEWSPDGKYLASCGVDGKVVVWELGQVNGLFTPLQKLTLPEDGSGLVKGIAWDPLGVYLVAQCDAGDHSTVVVWRSKDWQVETVLKDFFEQPNLDAEEDKHFGGTDATFFCRPSWSPEGSVIGISGMTNGLRPAAALINRDEWECKVAFIGHASPVEVIKFSPKLYSSSVTNNTPNDEMSDPRDPLSNTVDASTFPACKNYQVVCAVGSQDCSLSLWCDSNPRPLAVIDGLFEHSILDIAWLPSGLGLVASSYDGTMAIIKFPKTNLLFAGLPLVDDEQTKILHQLSFHLRDPLFNNLPTDVDKIQLVGRLEEVEDNVASAGLTCTHSQSSHQLFPPQHQSPSLLPLPMQSIASDRISSIGQQEESRTNEGKRRIKPQLLTPAPIESSPIIHAKSQPINHPSPKRRPSLGSGLGFASTTHEKSMACMHRIQSLPCLATPKRIFSNKVTVDKQSNCMVEVVNGGNKGNTKVFFYENESIKWEEALKFSEGSVISVLLDLPHIVLLTNDRKMLLYSQHGRRLLPPWILQGFPSFACSANQVLFIAFENCLFSMFDLYQRKCILLQGTLMPIIPTTVQNVSICYVTVSPPPIHYSNSHSFKIGLSDGHHYVYSAGLESFFRIEDDGVDMGIEEFNEYCSNNVLERKRNGKIAKDEEETENLKVIGLIKKLIVEDPHTSRNRSLVYLEGKLGQAEILNDFDLYKKWLVMYVYRLVKENLYDKAIEIYRQIISHPLSLLPPLPILNNGGREEEEKLSQALSLDHSCHQNSDGYGDKATELARLLAPLLKGIARDVDLHDI